MCISIFDYRTPVSKKHQGKVDHIWCEIWNLPLVRIIYIINIFIFYRQTFVNFIIFKWGPLLIRQLLTRVCVVPVKVCDKQHVIKEKKAEYIKREKEVLNILGANTKATAPFFVKLFCTFQDPNRLCILYPHWVTSAVLEIYLSERKKQLLCYLISVATQDGKGETLTNANKYVNYFFNCIFFYYKWI